MALVVALVVVGFELVALSWIRWWFLETGFVRSLAHIGLAGSVIVGVSAALGASG